MLDLPLSELRSDPICGRKVYIAEDRAGRPNDYTGVKLVERGPELCPFCVGHEGDTPASIVQVPDSGSWQVRVIPNKYPAVRRDATHVSAGAVQPVGSHEVIIESPRHLHDITELSLDELSTVLAVCRDRLRHWSSDPDLRHATIFKNVGFAAGASLEHVHSQLVALPYVPVAVQEELAGSRGHFDAQGECIFCRLLADERRAGVRMVAEEGAFAAISAYAGRQPYETWILPTSHSANFSEVADGDLRSLSSLLQQLIRRLQFRLPNLSYNLLLHTLPFHSSESNLYHWHWELIPRSSHLAGLEWGAGVHINPLSPERAAERLRDGT